MDRVEVQCAGAVGCQAWRVGVHVGQEQVGFGNEGYSPPVFPHSAFVGFVNGVRFALGDVCKGSVEGSPAGRNSIVRFPARPSSVCARVENSSPRR